MMASGIRRRSRLRGIGVPVMLFVLWPMGCQHGQSGGAGGAPLVRVLLHENRQRIEIAATGSPVVHAPPDASGQPLHFSQSGSVPVTLSASGWRIGAVSLPSGELLLEQPSDGAIRVDDETYRGRFRLVPTTPGRFDVVNELDIDSYLKGVLSSELFPNWHPEAYRAQAIAARTYALYEARTAGVIRHFDVYSDQRSQVYGGMRAETARSRDGADSTAGVVVAFGPEGHETIFKSYFSACCGGISQSATDAFGEPTIPPLADRNKGPCCTESPKFNWGPIVISKAELTRRVRAWGAYKKRPEQSIGNIARVDLRWVNRFGRPTHFTITDVRGMRYSLSSEQFREAANTDATANAPKLFSSFCKPVDEGAAIRFTDGHGYGHGVGLCQWCAQHQAVAGWSHESILLDAYPQAKLMRAY